MQNRKIIPGLKIFWRTGSGKLPRALKSNPMGYCDTIVEREFALARDLQLYGKAAPLVLYGAQRRADKIYRYLAELGISVDIVAVDGAYLQERTVFHDIPVIDIATLLAEPHTRYNYLIAFWTVSPEKINALRQTANHIFHYDCGVGLEGADAVNVPFDFFHSRRGDMEWVFTLMADAFSRDVLAAHINQRISGKFEYKRPYYTKEQYFSDIMPLSGNEIFVDCGAYTGDTVLRLLSVMEKRHIDFTGKIFAFEPDANNFAKLAEHTARLINCRCFHKGIWEFSTILKYNNSSRRYDSHVASVAKEIIHSNFIEEADVEVVFLDEMFEDTEITFIKMDIEGSELPALRGAKKIISTYKPKLAICIYHKKEDIFDIPQYIYSICPDYDFYIRSHSLDFSELVLYAV
jgi:FkbM family methyltransferase